jgi:hypothetical protein
MDSITQEQTLIVLYVPRKYGGRGMLQTEGAYTAKVMKLTEFVESK